MGQEIHECSPGRQLSDDRSSNALQDPAPAERSARRAAPPETEEAREARQAALRDKAEARRWRTILSGEGSLHAAAKGSSASRRPVQTGRVCASEFQGRDDLTAGEPHWNYNNFTVKVSDAEGRFTTVSLVDIRSMSRGELRRRALELARGGKSSNLP
jgi:hypothetical protein